MACGRAAVDLLPFGRLFFESRHELQPKAMCINADFESISCREHSAIQLQAADFSLTSGQNPKWWLLG